MHMTIGRSGWMASWLVSVSLFSLAVPTACLQNKEGEGSTIGGPSPVTTSGGTASAGTATNTGAVPAATGGSTGASGPLDLVDAAGTGGSAASGQAGNGVGGGCAATFVQAKVKTLAMFLMLDQSKSMDNVVDQATNTTRWKAVTTAFASFVNNPATADIPVGLQYFGLPLDGAGGTGGGAGTGGAGGGFGPGPGPGPGLNVSCTASDYAEPEVPIAPLSSNAKAIIDSMAAHAPLTTTPTLPAIQGGVQFVAKYATDHPDNKVVLVLATDGEPSGCDSSLDNVTMAAAAGLSGMPSVSTYVIGVGSNLANLDAIALAGGTQKAFLVSDANVQQDLLMALTAIQGAIVPCEYSVPLPTNGMDLDFGKVNVQYTPTTGAPQILQKVTTPAECPASGNFWYYDDNAAPTRILLCQNTCEQLTSVGAGKVEIVLDCKETVSKPPF
jgi:hypothetical protein